MAAKSTKEKSGTTAPSRLQKIVKGFYMRRKGGADKWKFLWCFAFGYVTYAHFISTHPKLQGYVQRIGSSGMEGSDGSDARAEYFVSSNVKANKDKG